MSSAPRASLGPILGNLGRQICQPLDGLQLALARILDGHPADLDAKQRGYAQTMLTLCREINQLTLETMGEPDAAEPDA